MSTLEDFQADMRLKHDAMNKQLRSVTEDQMEIIAKWDQQEMPVRNVFYRLVTHELDHTVHMVKTLKQLDISVNEAEMIITTLQEARGKLEGLLVSISDENFDKAPDGEWSPRQVLQHIVDVEESYTRRIDQAIRRSS
mgnify:CR=1 FL=1